MTLQIPEFALVVLIGPSGSGKSTFAHQHFMPTEVLSSDTCRALVSDDENSGDATKDAFEVLHFIAAKRLERMKLTVVDATNVQPHARAPLVALARRYHCLPVAIVLDLPEAICQERNAQRADRDFGLHVIRNHRKALRRSIKKLRREGFRHVYTLSSPEEVAGVTIERTPLWTDRRHLHGPFDIIGDVHGCGTELEALLGQLGYVQAAPDAAYAHSEGRTAVFVGDLVDRGPRNVDVYRTVRRMEEAETALCVPGNHDVKLMRALKGRKVKVAHGLEVTLAEIEALPEDEREPLKREMANFIDRMVSHFVLDDGKLVVAHAGLKEKYQGRASRRVRDFALYGETTGEIDEFGLPVRHNWAAEYRGEAMVVYGHTPVPDAEWLNNTIDIDTGCVFGGKLTALRYPERELVSVPAERVYAEPVRPLLPATPERSAQQIHDDDLDLADVRGKLRIETRLRGVITIREENSAAALEVMSRFAADPKWLIYLPPTMSPPASSTEDGLLEHPKEAFDYFRKEGVTEVLCEEKHMGSRAVVVVCRSPEAARARFGITTGEAGIVYTRTGRRFFDNMAIEQALLDHLRTAMDQSGFWTTFETDWACFDCELMPWSAKAQDLLRRQYAAVGSAAEVALTPTLAVLDQALAAGLPVEALRAQQAARLEAAMRYRTAYRQYCWPVERVEDFKLAPFHLLATEGQVHADQTHRWHIGQVGSLVQADDSGILFRTDTHAVTLGDAASEQAAIDWWTVQTAQGGEGMVVKPLDFIAQGPRGLVQPAVKCRGREYLRIIYGPDYTAPEHLERLRQRNVGRKRSLALREFALGLEALERFVRREPLRKVHQCVFGVLALESEPVDPRL
ncbi:MAG: polynucleotide kinase-phosphatase [Rhodothermales bacterium]